MSRGFRNIEAAFRALGLLAPAGAIDGDPVRWAAPRPELDPDLADEIAEERLFDLLTREECNKCRP